MHWRIGDWEEVEETVKALKLALQDAQQNQPDSPVHVLLENVMKTDPSQWLPTGASAAVIQQVAINGHRVAALGQATTAAGTVPFAELSVNGGTNWQQVPFSSPGPDTDFTALTADSAGFSAAGLFGSTGDQNVAVWTSAAGTSWKPSQAGDLNGAGSWEITALAPSGSTVAGVGSVATQQSQQTVTLTLPAR